MSLFKKCCLLAVLLPIVCFAENNNNNDESLALRGGGRGIGGPGGMRSPGGPGGPGGPGRVGDNRGLDAGRQDLYRRDGNYGAYGLGYRAGANQASGQVVYPAYPYQPAYYNQYGYPYQTGTASSSYPYQTGASSTSTYTYPQ